MANLKYIGKNILNHDLTLKKGNVSGSTTGVTTMYTCPAATSAVVHAMYLSNVDGTNDATITVSSRGSANFNTRRYV